MKEKIKKISRESDMYIFGDAECFVPRKRQRQRMRAAAVVSASARANEGRVRMK